MTLVSYLQGMSRERRTDLAYVAFLILWSVGGVCLAFVRPELCAALMLGGLGIALWRWRSPLDVLLALSGLTFGPVLEYFATGTALWTYPHTSFSGLPLWIFTLWPVFPIALVRLTHTLLPPSKAARVRPSTELMMGLGILATEIPLLVLFGTSHPMQTTVATGVILAAAFVTVRSPQATLMLLLSGIVGPLCESLPVYVGAWSYPAPYAFGLPMWLPTGYALFGFALVRVAVGVNGLMAAASAPALARE